MAFVADKWSESHHAESYGVSQGNTFCAQCHSPLQADPGATEANNVALSKSAWEGVTCPVCHPPDQQREQWGTPIGIYDVATGEYSPVSVADANELCTHCHTGPRHAPTFQGPGLTMLRRGVRCIDCHMAKIAARDPDVGMRRAHDFNVEANLPHSCGVVPGGCHSEMTEAWAKRQIAGGAIHGTRKAH